MKLICLLFLIPFAAFSATQKLRFKDQQFLVSMPQDWKAVNELYGIPITLLGPMINNETRAVIQVIPTGEKSSTLTIKDSEDFSKKYAEGRRQWIKSQNGNVIDILPGKLSQTSKGILILEAGVSYQIHQKSFAERTYYVQCPKQIVHLKIVLNVGLIQSMPTAESIVRSFQCDG